MPDYTKNHQNSLSGHTGEGEPTVHSDNSGISKMADVRDLLNAIVGAGKDGLRPDDRSAVYNHIGSILGKDAAQKLITQAQVFNQRPDIYGKSAQQRISQFHDEVGAGDSKASILPSTGDPNAIPKPNYNDPKSRLQYAQNFTKKYGPLMQGRGDTPLKIDEIPRGGSDTAKNIAAKAAIKYGLDPALLYSSSMEEGMSGLFKDKSGLDTKHRKPGDFGYQSFYGDKEFPVNGNESFGLPDFSKRFPELVKGGYLPKEFASKFRGKDGDFSGNDFKTVEDGMQAKAAVIKYNYDDVDKFASKNGITLSPKQKEFFALVGFNGGEGTSHKMISDYNKNGLLKDDSFIDKRPTSGIGLKSDSYKAVHENISRRVKMASALKNEGLF